MGCLFPFLVPAILLGAQTPIQAPEKPLNAAQRSIVVESLARELIRNYIFPHAAAKTAAALQEKLGKGGYDGATTPKAFAEALSTDLQSFGQDRHFRVRYDPEFKPQADEDAPPTPKAVGEGRAQAARRGWGIAKVEILPGNVGLLDVRGFGPAEFCGPAFTNAIGLLSGTYALILDLRQNGGGDPETVALLCSYFFDEGDVRHLNDIYNRPKDRTRQYWTMAVPGPRYGGTKPVYVLTSSRTFSGGEECAYDLQTQKRATLIGETTGGGANPGGPAALSEGFVAFIPTGRAINPITKINWEHVGVAPEVKTPATEALKVAHAAALKNLLEGEKDTASRQRLTKLIDMVEKGETEPARYTR